MSKNFMKVAIFIMIAFVVLYFISYKKWEDTDFDKVDITYRETDSTDDKVVIKDGEQYKYLYNNVNYELLQNYFGQEFYKMYYHGDKFNDEYYISVAILNMIKDEANYNCNIEKEISAIDIKNKINDIFGSVTYSNKSFVSSNNFLNVTYDEESDSFKIITGKCSGFDYSSGGINTEYIKSSLVNDYLYIYEKAFYLDYSYNANGGMIFNYHSGVDENSKIAGTDYESIDISKMPTYIYVFGNNNGSYFFKYVSKES